MDFVVVVVTCFTLDQRKLDQRGNAQRISLKCEWLRLIISFHCDMRITFIVQIVKFQLESLSRDG